jgi:deoxyribodipyrimidine photo-lyase
MENTIANHFPLKKHPYFTMEFGRKRLADFPFEIYDDTRNFPAIDGSTRLSPYIRFGVFSIREVYHAVKQRSSTIVSELAWREFWYHIAHHFPTIYELEFQEKRRGIAWENDPYLISKIEQAETGYPLVDAALRQLYETNWMHNRLRMVVASFITKNCLIDWRWGEKLFKRYLIDYDEAVNYGNWQWSASVGPDPKPLRIFNPLLQSEKFDYEAKFIKKYIPELRDISAERIHSLELS